MSNQLIKCKVCGEEIAKTAKNCPKCGNKNKKPFYKKWWFITAIIIIVIAAVASSGGSDTTTSNTVETTNAANENIEYTAYDVSTLMDDLEGNAMNAETKYKNQYVEITGDLSVIDSDGSYISLTPSNDDFAIMGVQCYIKSDEQRAKVAQMSKGDTVTLKGKITGVGEIMGYSLNITEIP